LKPPSLKTKKQTDEAEANYKTLTMFWFTEKIEHTNHKGGSAGEEKRFNTEELTGFELSYKDHSIHLTALNIEKNKEGRNDSYKRTRIY